MYCVAAEEAKIGDEIKPDSMSPEKQKGLSPGLSVGQIVRIIKDISI
jgi:hypothetical protein